MTRTIHFRRKRKGRTNYKKRLSLLKSHEPRLVVRRTNKHLIAQIIEYKPDGDVVLASANSSELKQQGWDFAQNNIPAAYLTGVLLGTKAKGKAKSAVLDIGLHTPIKGSRVFATLKGVVESGIKVPASDDCFPAEERLNGKHIEDHTKKPITTSVKKIKEKLLK